MIFAETVCCAVVKLQCITSRNKWPTSASAQHTFCVDTRPVWERMLNGYVYTKCIILLSKWYWCMQNGYSCCLNKLSYLQKQIQHYNFQQPHV